ncbi:MAG: SLC13 family permease, partial [Gemmatimonadota bacterium]
RHRGLEPVATARPPEADPSWELHEAVVAPGSPLVGTTVKEAEFRARYNAAVIAVRRHGEEVEKRIGDITLRPGDTLLMEADPAFERAFRDSTDFFLVSRVEDSEGRKHEKAPRALAVLAAVVVGAATGLVPLPLAALGGGLAMLLTGCLTPGEARRSVDWSVLVAIGAAIGLAGALRASGAAELLGGGLEWVAGAFGPVGLLVGVFVGTVLLTEVVINQAAAALAFPVVVAAAASQGLDPRPLVLTAAVAASMSFSTPLSYQTNLLVYGPGRYRFTDFTRVGVPLQLLLGLTAVLVIPQVWPLTG